MTADPSRVAAAHTLLAQLGVTVADLQATPDHTRRMPTVAEYLPRVMAAATPSSCRTYGTYWTRMAAVWGDWPLDTVAARIVRLAAKFDNNARQALPLIGHPPSGHQRQSDATAWLDAETQGRSSARGR
ncbi:hypothetical protein AB0M54_44645 [Actinoplanes sp. NPDC051470]|uniref:hypothetical protein n=1 Tax=Actinoplanes sp. NPDC051470 TaxID=3157224 RepID=UPI0034225580